MKMAEYGKLLPNSYYGSSAKEACLRNSSCAVIVDYQCDGSGFWTCSGASKPSMEGSCTWVHVGKQNFNT